MATPADLDETIELVEKLDRRILTRIADVRDHEAVKALAGEAVAELGPHSGAWTAQRSSTRSRSC